MSQQNAAHAKAFRTRCLNFYVELAHQISMRFPFNKSEIDALQFCGFTNPNNLNKLRNISPLLTCFNLDIDIDTEHRLFLNTYKGKIIDDPESEKLFW